MPRLAALALAAALLGGCATLPPGADFPRAPSVAFDHPEGTGLGRKLALEEARHPGKSGLRLLPAGVGGFLARGQMIEAAERTLDVQYFILQGDDTGKLLTEALLRAADRGVRVRLLLDDADVSGRDTKIAALDAHPNIQVRIFNPFAYRGHAGVLRALEFALNAPRLDYRMHNKLFVADNAVALAGGRNIGDEYFEVGTEMRFGDYDVFVAGRAVKRLSASFDEFWNSELSIPIGAIERPAARALEEYRAALVAHRREMQGTPYLKRLAGGQPLAGMLSGRSPLVWTRAAVLYDRPQKRQSDKDDPQAAGLLREVARAAAEVKSELLIVSPYFVPGDEGMELLTRVRRRGVRVRVVTNSLASNSVLAAHAGYARYRVALLERGIELYEVRPAPGQRREHEETLRSASGALYSLHAKAFVFDRSRVFIGSMNFDQRSMHLNTEIGLMIEAPELARQVAARVGSITRPEQSYRVTLAPDDPVHPLRWRTAEAGKSVEYDGEPALGNRQRVKAGLLSLLPFERQL